MKNIIISFLFFIVSYSSHANFASDSLSYYVNLVNNPKTADDLANSYEYISNSVEKAFNVQDSLRAIYCIYNLSSIDYKEGFYAASEESATRGLKLIGNKVKDDYSNKLRKSFYNLLGMLYRKNGSETLAVDLYNNAFKYAQTNKDTITLFNNLSNVYKDFSQFSRSKEFLDKAIIHFNKNTDSLTRALVLDNLGFVLSKLNKKNALENLLEALKIRENLEDYKSVFKSNLNLAEYYKDHDDTKESIKYASEALKIATTINSLAYKKEAMGFLLELGDLQYAKSYKMIADSLETFNKSQTNKLALMKFDYVNKNNELKELELQSANDKYNKLLLKLVVVILILLAIFIYFLQRSKHKKDRLKQIYATESRISKHIHDDVANDLFQIMTKLERKKQISETLKNELNNLYYRTRDISKEHSLIDTKDKTFEENLGSLLESFNSEKTNIIVKGINTIIWKEIDDLNRVTVYKVLQELLINMKKHSDASLVVLAFHQNKKNLTVTYSDNGIGCVLEKSTGLINTENRINSINGTISFDSEPNKGFKAKISI
ncbi:hypothetical protein [Winogradskyella sp. PE311]|uniref:tetratricopeptide repeat-containing sensor histidine kinase n=1 Tax=Winogradskyella sp. PE311 TaxID=3366943 RepID=UPI00397F774F